MKSYGPRLDLVKWATWAVYGFGGPENDPFLAFHETLSDPHDRIHWAALFSAAYSNTDDDHDAQRWLDRARIVELPDGEAIIAAAFRGLGLEVPAQGFEPR